MAFTVFMYWLIVSQYIPVCQGAVGSVTMLPQYQDASTFSFDPFDFGFNFAIGLSAPLDPKVATMQASYITETWTNGVSSKVTENMPLKACDAASGFPLSTPRNPVSLQCIDPLPARNLTGNQLSDSFKYIQISLIPCNSATDRTCAANLKTFFAANPKF